MCVNPVCLPRYSITCVNQQLSKRPKIGFQDQLSLNAGQKYCRMLQVEYSAIFSTYIKLPIVINIFVLSTFEWLFYTGFTVYVCLDKSVFGFYFNCIVTVFCVSFSQCHGLICDCGISWSYSLGF